MIFDTHCHLNDPILYEQIDDVIFRASQAGVTRFLVVGYNKETSFLAVSIAKKYPNCYAAVGFHPTEVFEISEADYQEVINLISEPKVVAIGEIGLDYHWVKESDKREKEKEWFIKQIELANSLKKPICIHNRDSHEDCLKILKEHHPKYGFVMHCFSGSKETMNELLKIKGCYISLGGPVTFLNAKSLKEIAKEVPLDRLLIETDSPYLSPHPLRGKMNEPKNITLVRDSICEIRNISKEQLEDITYKNSNRVFGINDEN